MKLDEITEKLLLFTKHESVTLFIADVLFITKFVRRDKRLLLAILGTTFEWKRGCAQVVNV